MTDDDERARLRAVAEQDQGEALSTAAAREADAYALHMAQGEATLAGLLAQAKVHEAQASLLNAEALRNRTVADAWVATVVGVQSAIAAAIIVGLWWGAEHVVGLFR